MRARQSLRALTAVAGAVLACLVMCSCNSSSARSGGSSPQPSVYAPPPASPSGAGPVLDPNAPPVQVSTENIEKPTPERGYALTLATSLNVSLARGEITGRVLRLNISTCQALPLSGVPLGVSVDLFHMPMVTTSSPSFQGGVVGRHYDPLVPLSTTSGVVCPGETYVWADITVGASVAPGAYSFWIGSVPVNLTVWNLTLPAQPTMPLYVGLGSYGLLAAHGLPGDSNVGVQGPLTAAYVAMFRSHRIEPEGQRIVDPAVKGDGTLDLDNWSTLSASYRELVMDGALAPVCVRSPSGIGYSWATAAELQGWEKAITAEPTLSKAWAYITDEPTDIAGTAARAQLVRDNAPHLKTMVTAEPTIQLLGLIDHFTVVMDWFKQPGHWQDYSQAPGYFLYGSCMAHGSCTNGTTGQLTGTPDLMLDENDVQARAFPLVAYMMGAEAALYYNSIEMYGQGDPWTSQYLFGGNGDGTLVYPGVQGQRGFTSNQPVGSIRLKGLRQGQYDLEYVKLARDAGLATNIATLVPDQFHWSRSNADYEAFRVSVGNALSH